MFCGNCGNQLPEGVKFCPKCGQKVISAILEKSPESPCLNDKTTGDTNRKEKASEPVKQTRIDSVQIMETASAVIKKKKLSPQLLLIVTAVLLVLVLSVFAAISIFGSTKEAGVAYLYVTEDNRLMYMENLDEATDPIEVDYISDAETSGWWWYNENRYVLSSDGNEIYYIGEDNALYKILADDLKKGNSPEQIEKSVTDFQMLTDGYFLYTVENGYGEDEEYYICDGNKSVRLNHTPLLFNYKLAVAQNCFYYSADHSYDERTGHTYMDVYKVDLTGDSPENCVISNVSTVYTALDSDVIVYGVNNGQMTSIYRQENGKEPFQLAADALGVYDVTVDNGVVEFNYLVKGGEETISFYDFFTDRYAEYDALNPDPTSEARNLREELREELKAEVLDQYVVCSLYHYNSNSGNTLIADNVMISNELYGGEGIYGGNGVYIYRKKPASIEISTICDISIAEAFSGISSEMSYEEAISIINQWREDVFDWMQSIQWCSNINGKESVIDFSQDIDVYSMPEDIELLADEFRNYRRIIQSAHIMEGNEIILNISDGCAVYFLSYLVDSDSLKFNKEIMHYYDETMKYRTVRSDYNYYSFSLNNGGQSMDFKMGCYSSAGYRSIEDMTNHQPDVLYLSLAVHDGNEIDFNKSDLYVYYDGEIQSLAHDIGSAYIPWGSENVYAMEYGENSENRPYISVVKGEKTTKITDVVEGMRFIVLLNREEDNILYIKDGNLYLWNGEESRQIAQHVNSVKGNKSTNLFLYLDMMGPMGRHIVFA